MPIIFNAYNQQKSCIELMDLDLKKLRHLITVAESGSITQAAELLHITQPALSRSINALEDQYGVQIFERGRLGVSLTATGRQILAEAQRLLSRAQLLQKNLAAYSKGEAGSIAFGVGPLIASVVLPTLSSEWLNQFPQLKLTASVKSPNFLLQELLDNEIELLFCGAEQLFPMPDIAWRSIGKIPFTCAVRPGHPLCKKKKLAQSEIDRFPILCGESFNLFAAATKTQGFVCDNYDILRTTTKHTDGLWFTSARMIQADLDNGELVDISKAHDRWHRSIEILCGAHAETTPSPAADRLITRVAQLLN